ncbi:MAG: hypothetical protein C0603_13190 [Denitrovibrio sp.]|nr:MAG: hypothetical protein C0603_13190 [Denitrovibrio sp.]
MNNAFMVNDSISPSTQPATCCTKTSTGFSSFRDVYEKNLSSREDEVNISSSAQNLLRDFEQNFPQIDNEAVTANQEVKVDDSEMTETEKLFDRMQYLLLLNYIGEDPEEEEEEDSESGEGGDDFVEATTTEADDALAEYKELMESIEQARKDALEKCGTDKNKYAFAIDIYNKAKEEDEDTTEEKILTNGKVVKEKAEDKPAKTM